MEQKKTDPGGGGGGRTYCVTGATGYIGSWLVKSLLERGFSVHAAVRNPANCNNLLALWGGGDRLRLFRADLNEEGSFDDAVNGCHGVFHVAASMEVIVKPTDNRDNYVQSDIIDPSIRGALNILKSCLRSKSVKRVVFTSSISTMTARNDHGEWLPVVHESCRTSVDVIWNRKSSGWVYVLSKRLTEDAAFQFANENGIRLVSIITTTVAGPFLTSTVPLSIRVLLSPLTGDSELLPILSSVNSRMGSVALVHTEDICNAHMYLMEHDRAEGRYICCTNSCTISELVHHLAKLYPSPNLQRVTEEEVTSVPTEISSKKLKDLGFRYKYGLLDVIHQTLESCMQHGFLPPTKTQRK
ncbi:putative anthocyanidin reductase [Cynara cardunculus var. scolymus]|uniref:putative anthocyanidin reductase n=1 Tax=Cynara cardunculus var. scolymus TaxID=59895 RepID=UPI000D62BD80|nr:putative anthocyanidin reductase [Cynara cardunculus var. scolymus]